MEFQEQIVGVFRETILFLLDLFVNPYLFKCPFEIETIIAPKRHNSHAVFLSTLFIFDGDEGAFQSLVKRVDKHFSIHAKFVIID